MSRESPTQNENSEGLYDLSEDVYTENIEQVPDLSSGPMQLRAPLSANAIF